MSPHRSRSVLVVDDDVSIRRVLKALLERHQFAVVTVGSGHEALQHIQTAGSSVGLVLLDMMMPGLNGEQTFDLIRRLHPDLPVLLMSGCCERDAVDRLLEAGRSDFVSKPMIFHALIEKIRYMLEHNPRHPQV